MDDGTYVNEKEEKDVPTDLAALNIEDDQSVEEEVVHSHGDVFVTMRALNAQPNEDDCNIQRTNIFYTTCLIKEKVCLMIIDNGSCTNLASTYLVDKIKLRYTNHPRP